MAESQNFKAEEHTLLNPLRRPEKFSFNDYRRYVRPEEERGQIRATKAFQNSNYKWATGHHGNASKIGKLLEEIKELPPTADKQDWMDYYEASHGKKEMWDNIIEFKNRWELSLNEAVNFWIIRVIDQTWEGWQHEMKVITFLTTVLAEKRPGQIVRGATDFEDRTYAVDIVVTDSKKKPVAGIQVKPRSYFTSTGQAVVRERTIINPKKNEKFVKKYGVPVFYVLNEDVDEQKLHFLRFDQVRKLI